MEDVIYKGVKTLMVYTIPSICKGIPPKYKDKGKRQYPKDMCYIGVPFSKIIEISEVNRKI